MYTHYNQNGNISLIPIDVIVIYFHEFVYPTRISKHFSFINTILNNPPSPHNYVAHKSYFTNYSINQHFSKPINFYIITPVYNIRGPLSKQRGIGLTSSGGLMQNPSRNKCRFILYITPVVCPVSILGTYEPCIFCHV